jgi:hypothetical protein
VIKYPKDKMVNQSVDGLGTVVEARTGWNDVRAGLAQAQHVFKVDRIVRRFARHQHEPAAFLESDISRPVDQIRAQPGRDRPERTH